MRSWKFHFGGLQVCEKNITDIATKGWSSTTNTLKRHKPRIARVDRRHADLQPGGKVDHQPVLAVQGFRQNQDQVAGGGGHDVDDRSEARLRFAVFVRGFD